MVGPDSDSGGNGRAHPAASKLTARSATLRSSNAALSMGGFCWWGGPQRDPPRWSQQAKASRWIQFSEAPRQLRSDCLWLAQRALRVAEGPTFDFGLFCCDAWTLGTGSACCGHHRDLDQRLRTDLGRQRGAGGDDPLAGPVIQEYRQQKADADQHPAYYHPSLHVPLAGPKQAHQLATDLSTRE